MCLNKSDTSLLPTLFNMSTITYHTVLFHPLRTADVIVHVKIRLLPGPIPNLAHSSTGIVFRNCHLLFLIEARISPAS